MFSPSCKGHSVAKIFLLLFNVVLVVVGAILITFGVAFPKSVVNIHDAYVDTAISYFPCILIAVGFIAIILGIIGFIGAFKEIRSLLILFVVSLIIIFLLELILGAVCVVFSDELEEEISKAFQDSIRSYKEEPIMKMWDRMQSEMLCCGYDNYMDWSNFTDSDFKRGMTPDSCCVYHAEGCGVTIGETIGEYIHSKGCKETILRNLEGCVYMQGILAVGCGIFQIVGIIAAIMLYSSLKRKEQYV